MLINNKIFCTTCRYLHRVELKPKLKPNDLNNKDFTVFDRGSLSAVECQVFRAIPMGESLTMSLAYLDENNCEITQKGLDESIDIADKLKTVGVNLEVWYQFQLLNLVEFVDRLATTVDPLEVNTIIINTVNKPSSSN